MVRHPTAEGQPKKRTAEGIERPSGTPSHGDVPIPRIRAVDEIPFTYHTSTVRLISQCRAARATRNGCPSTWCKAATLSTYPRAHGAFATSTSTPSKTHWSHYHTIPSSPAHAADPLCKGHANLAAVADTIPYTSTSPCAIQDPTSAPPTSAANWQSTASSAAHTKDDNNLSLCGGAAAAAASALTAGFLAPAATEESEDHCNTLGSKLGKT